MNTHSLVSLKLTGMLMTCWVLMFGMMTVSVGDRMLRRIPISPIGTYLAQLTSLCDKPIRSKLFFCDDDDPWLAQIAYHLTITARHASMALEGINALQDPGLVLMDDEDQRREGVLFIAESSSALETQDESGEGLSKLRDLIEETVDRSMDLKRLSVNTFSLMAVEFLRMEEVILILTKENQRSGSKVATDNLDEMFESLSQALHQLGSKIQESISFTERRVLWLIKLGKIMSDEDIKLRQEYETCSIWKKVFIQTTFYTRLQLKQERLRTQAQRRTFIKSWTKLKDLQFILSQHLHHLIFLKDSLSPILRVKVSMPLAEVILEMREVIRNFNREVLHAAREVNKVNHSILKSDL